MGSEGNYFMHPSSFVDQPCRIGEGTKIWHFCHIMKNSQLGRDCSLGQNVFVASDVIIGNNVKIQNNVSIYTGVVLEDDFFCGPSCVFTNGPSCVFTTSSTPARKSLDARSISRRWCAGEPRLGPTLPSFAGTKLEPMPSLGRGR